MDINPDDYIANSGERPRFITSPKKEMFLYSCAASWGILKFIKHIFPTIVCGKTES
jgi:hypothetical protein